MSKKIKKSAGEKAFTVFNYIFMSALIFITVYPIWYVFVASFSDSNALTGNMNLLFVPIDFTLDAYKMMLKNPMILIGYKNTLIILVIAVTLNMFLTALGAYFMSRKNVLFKGPITLLIIFTMYFSGGLIPIYLNVRSLGLLDTYAALILPVAINTFNLIIMRTAFTSIPYSLEESAILDGAGHLTLLFRIILPLSKATVAVILLYYAVEHWNSWFNAMIFLNDRDKFPLQLVLQEILIQNDTSSMTQMVSIGDSSSVGETVKYAVIIVSSVPIFCVYPFIQRYFEKGVMIGAVKE